MIGPKRGFFVLTLLLCCSRIDASGLDWHYCMGVDVMSGDGNFSILASSGNIGSSVPPSGLSGWVSTMHPSTCCGSTCAPVTQDPAGWIALVSRGNCSFVQKILNAQHAGASAVVVSNNQGHDDLVIMGGHSSQITIPSIFVSHDSGQILRQYVDASVSDGDDSTSGLEIKISPCGSDGYYWDDATAYLPDYMLLLLVLSTMLCSMCTVGVIRWRIQLLYPETAPPVEEEVVINLPQRTCTENEDKECCICLDAFEVGDTVRMLPCRHEYHAHCIDKWLTTHHRTCPICKGDITRTDDDNAEVMDIEGTEPSTWYAAVAGWCTRSGHAYSSGFTELSHGAETELEVMHPTEEIVHVHDIDDSTLHENDDFEDELEHENASISQ